MNGEKLKNLLEELITTITRVGDYEEDTPYEQVAWELVQKDAFVAGIVDSLLEGHEVASENVAMLRKSQLTGTNWNLRSGSSANLAGDAKLLKHARLIESAQDECLKFLDGVH
jgi:hypothetical protein